MPFYQAIYFSKDRATPAEQQESILFRDVFKVPAEDKLANDEHFFLLGAIKPDGFPVWFAVKHQENLDLALLQQLAEQVLEHVPADSDLTLVQSPEVKIEKIQQAFLEVVATCQTQLPKNTDYALYSLIKFDEYKLISISTAGFSTTLDYKLIPQTNVAQTQVNSVMAKKQIVLQNDKGDKVYARVNVPEESICYETEQTFRVLPIAENLCLLENLLIQLERQGNPHITPLIRKLIGLANFVKNKYVADQSIDVNTLQDFENFLGNLYSYLVTLQDEEFLKFWIVVLNQRYSLVLIASHINQLLAQVTLAKTIAALSENKFGEAELKQSAMTLLNSMAGACQDVYIPAVVNGKPQTLNLDVIQQQQLQAIQAVTTLAEETANYLSYPDSSRYRQVIENLQSHPVVERFIAMKDIIAKAQLLQAVNTCRMDIQKDGLATAFNNLEIATQTYGHPAVNKAVTNFVEVVNTLAITAHNDEIQKLISIVEQTTAYLSAPTEMAYCQYKALANTVAGYSVLWQQLVGAMLILAGVVLAAACGAVIAASHGVALPVAVPVVNQAITWIAVGSAALLTSIGIFACYDARTKGLSRAMHDCASAVHKENKEKVARPKEKQRLLSFTHE